LIQRTVPQRAALSVKRAIENFRRTQSGATIVTLTLLVASSIRSDSKKTDHGMFAGRVAREQRHAGQARHAGHGYHRPSIAASVAGRGTSDRRCRVVEPHDFFDRAGVLQLANRDHIARPALLTSTSRLPKRSMVCSTSWPHCRWSVTSVGTTSVRRRAVRTGPPLRAGVRVASGQNQPRSIGRQGQGNAWPMPADAPVMTIDCPAKECTGALFSQRRLTLRQQAGFRAKTRLPSRSASRTSAVLQSFWSMWTWIRLMPVLSARLATGPDRTGPRCGLRNRSPPSTCGSCCRPRGGCR